MGALIDVSNPVVPFIGGFIVGAIVGGPIMEMVGGAVGGVMGMGDRSDANVAYAYHGRHGSMGNRMGMHRGHSGMGMGRVHPMMMMPPWKQAKAKPVHDDFEKEYVNVEQTYSNHLFINDHKSSV